MATIDDALRLAERFAVEATLRDGKPYRGLVDEFAHGWCVWVVPTRPPAEPPPIGSGVTVVLDRHTGLLAYYPAWWTEQVKERYQPGSATHLARPPKPSRAEAAQALPGPARIAMALTKQNVSVLAGSARGDAAPVHHPAVAGWLAAQPAGRLVRGAARHADLMLLSRLCADWAQTGSTDPAAMWSALAEPWPTSYPTMSDRPLGLGPDLPCCVTCQLAWQEFGGDPAAVDWTELREPVAAGAAPDPDRFPPAVAAVLVEGGWTGGGLDPAQVDRLLDEAREAHGAWHDRAAASAAREVFVRYPQLSTRATVAGVDCLAQQFTLRMPDEFCPVPELAAFERRLGVPVCPIGSETAFNILVVDARNRFFVLDQGGDWFLGGHVDEALANLATGRAPGRLRADGVIAAAR
ncbi:SUKH-3 domain-containing protein [Catellatospora chokoriensis]|uniref:SUKH-3 immunity protein of toxin-antitoxin system n=1 Tax=Catellatospora chokoriensis TaxID=310353 RepID=A0A8J3JRR8_9ACTN|nr:SUKH-3 domain-containing protein [Catellatospora chokoriensis]GIF89901.1 hypothetical protein Cch02nite_33450 [Catellatospora chokoriensis]